jgi:antitoxin component YwqK of YwqJK toxin-antitoxin module
MKRILLLLFTVPTLVIAQENIVSSDELDFVLNANGTFIVQFEEKPFSGICQEYHSKDMVAERGHYKDGLRDGTWSYYDENGQLHMESTYMNGVKIGVSRWSKNGQLVYEATYKEVEPDGSQECFSRSWYENGQLESEGTFNVKDGNPIGVWKNWSENGELIKE